MIIVYLLIIIRNSSCLLHHTSLIIERIRWDSIQPDHILVWILHDDVLAITHTQHDIDDGADNTPAVGDVQVHLSSEFARFVTQDTEDDMILS